MITNVTSNRFYSLDPVLLDIYVSSFSVLTETILDMYMDIFMLVFDME